MEVAIEKPLHKIRRFRKQSFEAAQRYPGYDATRDLDDYDDSLPTFKGKTLIQLIAEKSNGEQATSVLDIGCGAGNAILGIAESFPSVDVSGISGTDLRGLLKPPIRTKTQNLDYRIGDIQKTANIF